MMGYLVSLPSAYDSRPETHEHIAQVRGLLMGVAHDLEMRAHVHDRSKLEDPELSMFDVYRIKLDEVEHDSPEYRQHLKEMGEALEHHYRENRHHPEHFENGIEGMNLIDLIEMLCDWLAASRRQGDDPEPYITGGGRERFGYGDEIERLLLNTIPAAQRGLRA